MSAPVPGHALRWQGAPHTDDGKQMLHRRGDGKVTRYGGVGRALCECGALSEVLTSDARRKLWHSDHKADVRGAQV